jgi:hypothetical protein
MRDCNTEFDETSVDKSNTPESDTTINNTSDVNIEEAHSKINWYISSVSSRHRNHIVELSGCTWQAFCNMYDNVTDDDC